MAGKDNLKPPINKRSTEEQREIRSKGGKKSGEVRRAKKTMRELLDYLLEKEITNKKGEKATTKEAILVAAIKKAIEGDIKALQFIRDTIGEMPVVKQEVSGINGVSVVVNRQAVQVESNN